MKNITFQTVLDNLYKNYRHHTHDSINNVSDYVFSIDSTDYTGHLNVRRVEENKVEIITYIYNKNNVVIGKVIDGSRITELIDLAKKLDKKIKRIKTALES